MVLENCSTDFIHFNLQGTTVPREWEPVAGKKGVRRYVTKEIRQLVKRREEAHSQREAAQAGILMVLK